MSENQEVTVETSNAGMEACCVVPKARAGTELFFRAGVKKSTDACVVDAACGIKQYANIAEKLNWNKTNQDKK